MPVSLITGIFKNFKIYFMNNYNYYKSEFEKVNPITEYAPTVKIFANGNGQDTKNISLNAESSEELIMYLASHYLGSDKVQNVIDKLNKLI